MFVQKLLHIFVFQFLAVTDMLREELPVTIRSQTCQTCNMSNMDRARTGMLHKLRVVQVTSEQRS